MSLQFIIGNAGSGKSTLLYQQIIQESLRRPSQKFLVIVPEQFTMQTQKEFVRLHPSHAIMNIDILSFERLAYRVFDELGTDTLTVLEETGKNLLLRRVARERGDELKVLGRNMKKKGYISEIKSLISELSQYHISPDDFLAMADGAGMSASFRSKAEDILVMYRGFLEAIAGRYITAEELPELLTRVVDQSRLVKGSVMAFDGFTGFTPIQNQLLRKLLTLAERTMVTVTCDVRENLFGAWREEDLFAMSKKMIRGLTDMARETGTELEDVIYCDGKERRRFVPGGYLQHLEQNLFRRRAVPFGGECAKGAATDDAADAIRIYSLASPRKELEFVASQICAGVRQKGYRYRDFAVVCANLGDYRFLVPRVFDAYGIPYFVDAKTEIVFQPFTEFLSSLLQMVTDRFSYESVFRFLRSGLTDLSDGEIDELENYVLATRVRGFRKYDAPFAVMPETYRAEDLVALNEIREKFIAPLRPFCASVRGRKHTAAEISEALYRCIVSCDAEAKLKERSRRCEEAHEEEKAREYSQIYGIVMDLLDKMVFLLGEEQMPLEEYQELLESGFEAAKIGVIPPGSDCVMVGDIERTRLDHVRVLCLIGANDGAIPKTVGRGGILSQMERQQLKEAEYELAPTDREKAFMQKFYLYLTLTKPSDELIVSYTRVDTAGAALRRSYLIGTLQSLFPQVAVEEIERESPADYLASERTLHGFVSEALREYVAQESPKDRGQEESDRQRYLAAALSWYGRRRPDELETMLEAAFYHHRSEAVGRAVMKELTGRDLVGSVTRLEQYARCAYAYFLSYGLQLQERKEYALEPVDMGTLYHEALERYSRLLEDAGESWFSISRERMDELVGQAVLATYQNLKKTEILEDARDAYVLRRMEKTLRQTVQVLTGQVRKGKFVPRAFEVDFSQVSDLGALQFALDEMHRMRLRGKIDRLDTYETDRTVYVKIVDYKSGNQDFDLLRFYHGLQIQLVLYMGAAMEGVSREHPGKEVLPGAMFYYHIDHPLADGNRFRKPEEVKQEIFRQLKMRGLVNAQPEVIDALDVGLAGRSDVIPVTLKKDGTPGAVSSVMDSKRMNLLYEYVRRQIADTGRHILEGDFDCRPYLLGQSGGCDYCDYHSICGFDRKLEGYQCRRLEQLSNEEIMAKIEKELEEGGKEDGDDVDGGSAEGH